MDIKFIKNENLKQKPEKDFGFGKYFTDYMFTMEWTKGIGWHDATIKPYAPVELDPATMVLHYAQETFEGMKAYRSKDDEILLFRPEMNARRMAKSNERLCMPAVPEEDFVQAVKALVDVERDWVPGLKDHSLYIRPFMFATEISVGVHAASSYLFMIIVTPVGSYYANGLKPVKIYVEEEYVRASKGGTGFAKCGGNYAASIIAQEKAHKLGYDQVLWLDAVERRYVEEVGTMNAMFVINGEVYTAPIEGTVLDGITRNSCIKVLESWGYKVNEVKLDINDLMKAAHDGSLTEAFGTGTAAVISSIGQLKYVDDVVVVNNNEIGELTQKLYDELTEIQKGNREDKFGWVQKVEKQ